MKKILIEEVKIVMDLAKVIEDKVISFHQINQILYSLKAKQKKGMIEC